MSKLLPEAALAPTQALARLVRNDDLAQLDAWLVVIADDLDDAAWRTLPRGEWLRAECGRRKLRNGSVITARLDTAAQTLLIAGMRKRHASVFETLQLAGRMLKEAKSTQARRLGVSTLGLPGAAADSLVELKLFSPRANGDLKLTRATSEGNHLARWLTALPGNELTAASYRRRVSELARREGWRMQFLDSRTLKRRGAGAFLAVAQGNETDDAGILNRFVPAEIPWVHLDLAAGQRTGGLGHITTDITGFGVRYAVNLLTAQKILNRAASGKR